MSSSNWLPLALVGLPLLASAIAVALARSRSLQAWLALAALEIESLVALWLLGEVASRGVVESPIASARLLGMDLALALSVDSLSGLLALLLILGALANVAFYSARDDAAPFRGVQEPLLLLSLGTALGAVLSANLLTLYVFWHLAAVCFSLLIASGPAERALTGAVRYFVVNEVAAFCLLVAMSLGYSASANVELAGWATINDAALRQTVLALLVLAGALGSGPWPIHSTFNSASASGPPSMASYILSASNRVGLYLLFRVVATSNAEGWARDPWLVVAGFGAVTALAAGISAAAQIRPRRAVAYAAWVPLGCAMLGLGLGGQLGMAGALILVVGQTLGLACTLLALDSRVRQLGSPTERREKAPQGGLLTALTFGVGASSLVVIPPLAGYAGQGMIYQGVLGAGGTLGPWLVLSVLAGTVIAGVALVRVAIRSVTTGDEWGTLESIRPGQGIAGVTLLILGLVGLAMALLPNLWIGTLVAPAAAVQISGGPGDIALSTPSGQHAWLWLGLFTGLLLGLALALALLNRRARMPFLNNFRLPMDKSLAPAANVGSGLWQKAKKSLNDGWYGVADWIRRGEVEPFSLVRAAIMPLARLAARGMRLTFRLLLQ